MNENYNLLKQSKVEAIFSPLPEIPADSAWNTDLEKKNTNYQTNTLYSQSDELKSKLKFRTPSKTTTP